MEEDKEHLKNFPGATGIRDTDRTRRGCIHITRNSEKDGYGLFYMGATPEGLSPSERRAVGSVMETLKVITMPLCKIAEKLGVPGIPPNQDIPDGVWLTDGDNGYAYNWPELVDRMTERMVAK